MASTDVRAKAAEWLVQLKTTKETDELFPDFYTWINAAPEHRTAYVEVEEAWKIGRREMISAKRFGCGASTQFVEEVHAATERSRSVRRRTFVGAGVAAGAVILSMTAFEFYSWDKYETAYGELLPVALSDGSQIELNTNSRVRVRMTTHIREIMLDQGEALFTVAADKDRPFRVSVDDDILEAKGTEFVVRRKPNGVTDAYVQQGKVEVPYRQALSDREGGEKTIVVTAGNAVTISSARTQVVEIGQSAIKQRLAWTTGNIDIDGSLAYAVNEFNRYNKRRMKIEDASIADKHIQGVFKATDPDEFAREVERRFGIPVSFPTSTDIKNGIIRLGGSG